MTRPVIIAGAGPTGSTLALYLARHGVPVVLLEKCDSLPIDLRASTFHPVSLDLLAELDPWVVEQMLAKGLRVDRYQYRDRRTGETATFDMSLIADETAYPFRLQLEQYELTQLNCKRLQELELAYAPCTNDGGRDTRVSPDPGHREADRAVSVLLREGREVLGDLVVPRRAIARLVHRVADEAPLIRAFRHAVLPGQKSAGQRAVRDHS